MSDLTDAIEADVLAVFLNTDEFGISVSYTVNGGATTAINGVFNENSDAPEYDEFGRENIRSATLVISTDATSGIAAPAYDDYVSINSERWEVKGIEQKGVGYTLLNIERQTVIERGSGSLRRR